MLSATLEKMGKKREKKGKVKGRIEGKLETAKNMIKLNADIDFIHQATGLSVAEIEILIEKIEEEKIDPYFKKKGEIKADETDPELKKGLGSCNERLSDDEDEVLFEKQKFLNGNEEEVYTMMIEVLEKIGKKWEKRGKLKGRIEGKIETAKNMIKLNADIDFIYRVTGLSLEEIKKLTP